MTAAADNPQGESMASAAALRALLIVHGNTPRSHWAKTVEEIARMHPSGKLCILFKDTPATVDNTTLKLVTRSYQAISSLAPRLDLVPLLPAAGWTLAGASVIEDLTSLAVDAKLAGSDSDMFAIDSAREAAGLPTLSRLQVSASTAESDCGHPPRPHANGLANGHSDGTSAGSTGTSDAEPLSFSNVAVGGTFDRLHAGHRLLLCAAALVCTRTVYLGIAGDALLKNKSNASLLQNFGEREEIASAFLRAVRPGISVDTSELNAGPPKASTMPEMDALVVSRETQTGADLIQKQRREAGFAPIRVVTVDLVGAKEQSPHAPKLSSSILREIEAKRLSTDSGGSPERPEGGGGKRQ